MENRVWLPKLFVDEISILFSTIQQSGNVTEDVEEYRPIAKMFMHNEMSRLEIGNLHLENMNDLTELKVDTLNSKSFHSTRMQSNPKASIFPKT
jgi:hypothetical protein